MSEEDFRIACEIRVNAIKTLNAKILDKMLYRVSFPDNLEELVKLRNEKEKDLDLFIDCGLKGKLAEYLSSF